MECMLLMVARMHLLLAHRMMRMEMTHFWTSSRRCVAKYLHGAVRGGVCARVAVPMVVTPVPQISQRYRPSNTCSHFSRSSSLQRSAGPSRAWPSLACTASSPPACLVCTVLKMVCAFFSPPLPGHARVGGAAALQAIVDAVTACKYESTDTASDEVVLFRILHVLRACISNPASTCLSDDHVKTIFEACYRIGQMQPKSGKALLGTNSLLLLLLLYNCSATCSIDWRRRVVNIHHRPNTDAAQQTMLEITTAIFARLHHLSAAPLSTSSAVPPALADPDTDPLHKLAQPPEQDPATAAIHDAGGQLDAGVAGVASMTSPDAGDFAAAPADAPVAAAHGIVSVAPLDAMANGQVEHAPASVAGYGLPAISTIFEYIINLVGESKAEDVVFGLSLCLAALQAGGDGACVGMVFCMVF